MLLFFSTVLLPGFSSPQNSNVQFLVVAQLFFLQKSVLLPRVMNNKAPLLGVAACVCIMGAVLGLLSLFGPTSALRGDDLLLQALDAAYVELRAEGLWHEYGDQYSQDCEAIPSSFPYPDPAQDGPAILWDNSTQQYVEKYGTLATILNEGVVRVGTYENVYIVPALIDRIAQHYHTPITVQQVNGDPFDLLDSGAVDMTDGNMAVSGMHGDTRRSEKWQPGCDIYISYFYLMATKVGPQFADYKSFVTYIHEKLMMCEPVMGCAQLPILGQVLTVTFPGIGLQEFSPSCFDYMNSTTDFVITFGDIETAAIWSNTYAYKSDIVAPGSYFLRREVPQSRKVNQSYIPKDWEIGNEQLAQLFEAGLMDVVLSGYRSALFSYWKIPWFSFTDCLPQAGFDIDSLKDYTGVAKRVLDTSRIRVGVLSWDALPMINTTDPKSARGLLPAMEKYIFSWLANQFTLPGIQIEYVVYPSSDLVFQALERGEIDCTSMYFTTGTSVILSDGAPHIVNKAFRASCSTLGIMQDFVVETNSGINSVDELVEFLTAHPHKQIGLQSQDMLNLLTSWTLKSVDFTPIYGTVSELFDQLFSPSADVPALLLTLPYEVPDIYLNRYTHFDSELLVPNSAFFRFDKTYPCGDYEYEPELGEECERTMKGCADNCYCVSGYKAAPDSPVCESDESLLSTTAILGLVFGGVALILIVAGVAGFILVFPQCRKKWMLEGAQRARHSQMYARRSSGVSMAPLVDS
ncbi:hypothetical protein Pelo_8564 [Pelomyxa schiedti]|nr:hypothetical protein Pelo_8564 [Pelomyxa schiedti]